MLFADQVGTETMVLLPVGAALLFLPVIFFPNKLPVIGE